MDEQMQRIVERIQKMLALGRDNGASEGERDNAMRMVHAYLAKYNLDLAEVEGTMKRKDAKKEQEAGGARTTHGLKFFGRPWARCAAHAIADLCFCGYLYRSAKLSKNTQHLFIGREANAVTAAFLSEFVVVGINNEGRRRQRQLGMDNPWFLSFAWGAAMKVQERVKDLKAKSANQMQGTPGTAIVLSSYYDSEREANARYQQVAFPTLRTGLGGKGVRNTHGFLQGQEYGEGINLDRRLGR